MQRVRREPPAFRRLAVASIARRSPYLVRLTLAGPELAGFEPPLPAGSVRLLMPDEPGAALVLPVWNGNAFFHADGRRPLIRTVTPLRYDPDAGELDIEIVLHEGGPMAEWAGTVSPGAATAFSGPARGYAIAADMPTLLVAGDETAIPAIGQLLEAMPRATRVDVLVEIAHPEARVPLPAHPRADVRWLDQTSGAPPGTALVDAVVAHAIEPDGRIWAAGEAAAMQRIRRHLFGERGMTRAQAHVRGYWKHGHSGDAEEEPDASAPSA
jgi:NADPH-dependent ferric siderophore reductase